MYFPTGSLEKNGLKKLTKPKTYEEHQVVRKDSLSWYLSDYQAIFKLKTTNLLSKAHLYLQGLFQTERNKRNMERMAEETGSDYQKQQQFLTDSPWSAQELMDKVGVDTNNLLGEKGNQAFSIDESSNGKAGKHSVGVSHQYNGNKGKLDNCSNRGICLT